MTDARRFPFSFIESRWAGSVPTSVIFWKDMIVYGTTVNIVAAFLGFALFAGDAPTALAVTVYFAPLPYNVFIVAALWRSAMRLEEPLASTARVIGLVWLVVATAV